MREIAGHGPGRVFLAVLALSAAGMIAAPAFFDRPVLLLRWMPLPFAVGVVFLLIWLIAYLVYFFRYWPFRR